jgi:hypothetical protein
MRRYNNLHSIRILGMIFLGMMEFQHIFWQIVPMDGYEQGLVSPEHILTRHLPLFISSDYSWNSFW